MRLDKKVALKSVLFLTLSKLLKIVSFFLISSNYRNSEVTFNLLIRQKNLWKKIMRLMLEEVVMDFMSDGQMISFVQLFFQH